jgi:hypothetical protein
MLTVRRDFLRLGAIGPETQEVAANGEHGG